MSKRDTRTDIIKAGTGIIARQGFNATGIDAVLKAAGVPKGSFYHFFASKEAFGLAVLDSFAERYAQKLDEFFNDESLPHLQRLHNYLDYSMQRLVKHSFSTGCLAGNLGQELADQHESFRLRVEEIFQSWKQRFAACFRSAQTTGELSVDLEPDLLAEFLLTGLEGAILRARVKKSLQPVRDFIDILFQQILAKASNGPLL
jgi:TetR/AcrR family transcriptional repressor of nem operon